MEISLVLPVVAGREEEWRCILQELEGSRSGDAERTRRRLGIDTVRVWLQRTRRGAMAVILIEVDDPVQAISALAGSEETFDCWLKRGIEECHGVDLAHARSDRTPELVYCSGADEDGVAHPAIGGER